jgi:hypothetical protein
MEFLESVSVAQSVEVFPRTMVAVSISFFCKILESVSCNNECYSQPHFSRFFEQSRHMSPKTSLLP